MRTIKLIPVLFMVITLIGQATAADKPSGTYKDTRRLLSEMKDRQINSDKLATLFRKGDERIEDLIRALDDADKDISERAQVMIRYLGNEYGMKRLLGWYQKQETHPFAGPIPLPLNEWDYRDLRLNYLGKTPADWFRSQDYLYALALDGSERAKAVLQELMEIGEGLGTSTNAGYALEIIKMRQPKNFLRGKKDIAQMVLENAFFVHPDDKKYTSARFISFNGARDKALVEVYINRGPLAEEWYHLVVGKHGQDWRFVSISQVAIS